VRGSDRPALEYGTILIRKGLGSKLALAMCDFSDRKLICYACFFGTHLELSKAPLNGTDVEFHKTVPIWVSGICLRFSQV
jgi:hypothetical protein